MKREECSKCGRDARVVREDYVWEDVDFPVTLRNVELIRCDRCGNADVVIPKMGQLMRTLALAVVSKPYRLRGEEVRFLRKYLNMTGEEFSKLLTIDKTTLSKWENNADPVGEQSDRLIRTIVLGLDKGLRAELEHVIRQFSEIQTEPKKISIRMDPAKMSFEYAA